jgi:general stress protein 26
MSVDPKAAEIMAERFGKDSLIALATVEEGQPWVRTVNSYYEDGSFYVITHALSNKMRQIATNPSVAISGDWFTGRGTGENLGRPTDPANTVLMAKLRKAFASWYENGHTDESDPNTCILRIRLKSGVLFSHGTRYGADVHNQPKIHIEIRLKTHIFPRTFAYIVPL